MTTRVTSFPANLRAIVNGIDLKCEINAIYDEIRRTCGLLRYTCILLIIVNLRKKYHQDVMSVHSRKISRLLNIKVDVKEHILNISSYELSFFQKLVLCRGLKFVIPQRVSSIDVKAGFKKAYWGPERHLSNDNSKELGAATLRTVALNYIQRKSPQPPKTLLTAIEQLKWMVPVFRTYEVWRRPRTSHARLSAKFKTREKQNKYGSAKIIAYKAVFSLSIRNWIKTKDVIWASVVKQLSMC